MQNTAENVYKKMRLKALLMKQKCSPLKYRCGLWGCAATSSQSCHNKSDLDAKKPELDISVTRTKLKV